MIPLSIKIPPLAACLLPATVPRDRDSLTTHCNLGDGDMEARSEKANAQGRRARRTRTRGDFQKMHSHILTRGTDSNRAKGIATPSPSLNSQFRPTSPIKNHKLSSQRRNSERILLPFWLATFETPEFLSSQSSLAY